MASDGAANGDVNRRAAIQFTSAALVLPIAQFQPSHLQRRSTQITDVLSESGLSDLRAQRFDGAVNVKMFGAAGDGTTNDGPAFMAALAALKAIAVNQDVFYQGSPRLFVPAGHYY